MTPHGLTQKRTFAKYSDLSVKIEDKVYTSEVLRNIWALIGYMIDTFKNTAPDIYQKFVRKKTIQEKFFSWCQVLKKMICQSSVLDSPICTPLITRFTH